MGKWYHLAASTYTTTSGGTTTVTTQVYVNARLVLSSTGGFNPSNLSPLLTIGNAGLGTTASNGQACTGRLADVRVWGRTLSNAEMEMVYCQTVKPVFRDVNSGYVSVNLPSGAPTCTLDVGDGGLGSNAPFMRLGNAAGGVGNTVGLMMTPYTGRTGGASSQIHAVDDGNSSAHLVFSTAASGSSSTLAERMRLSNAGQLGIGTNNPAFSLDVAGTLRATGGASLQGGLTVSGVTATSYRLVNTNSTITAGPGGSTAADYLQINGGSGATGLVVSNASQVGIGTTSPAYTCDVNGSLRVVGGSTMSTLTAGTIVSTGVHGFNNQVQNQVLCLFTNDSGGVSSTSTNYYGLGVNSSALRYNVPSNANHIWYINTAEAARITSTGLGVLKTPTCALDVAGTVQGTSLVSTGTLAVSGGVTLSAGGSLAGQFTFSTGAGGYNGFTWGSNFSNIYDDGDLRIKTDDNMHFHTGGTERMTLTTTGLAITVPITATQIISSGPMSGITTISQSGSHVIGPSGASQGAGPRLQLYGPGGLGGTSGIDMSGYGGQVWSMTATDNGSYSASLDISGVPAQGQAATNRMHFNAANSNVGVGGQTNPQYTLDVNGGVRQSIQVHGHWNLTSSLNISSGNSTVIPGSSWSLVTGTFVNTSASAVLTSNGQIVFPFKGVWNITMQTTFTNSPSNTSNAGLFIVNTYAAAGVSGNTSVSNRLGTNGGYGFVNAMSCHTGVFSAGDIISPSAYSTSSNTVMGGGNSTITITLVTVLN